MGKQQSVTDIAKSELPSVVASYLDERRAKGIKVYGCELTTHNGRSALLDALEEAADLVCYLTQEALETKTETIDLEVARSLLISIHCRYSETRGELEGKGQTQVQRKTGSREKPHKRVPRRRG